MRCLRPVLHVCWLDEVTNLEVLQCAGTPSMYALVSQTRPTRLVHVRRLDLGRIPTDLLYQELAEIVRSMEQPCLRFKDICKKDMKLAGVDINSWARISDDRRTWSIVV